MKIELSDERRIEFINRLQGLFRDEFDDSLSQFRANEIANLCLKTLCPTVYNQAVQDVRAHLQIKIDDLDGDVYADVEITGP
jgi:uncharacterized protein (DUF2164 family)